MSDTPQKPAQASKTTAESVRPDADRRRFLVAGLVAAPLIVTLSSRPAFAQSGTAYGYAATSDGFETISG